MYVNPLGAGLSAVDHAPTSSETYTNLTRAQFADFIRDIAPYEDKLFEYANDPTVVSNAMNDAGLDVAASFDRQQGATQRNLDGLGLSLDQDEQRVVDRTSNLQRTLASVGAKNRARDRAIGRQQAILGNPVPQLGLVA